MVRKLIPGLFVLGLLLSSVSARAERRIVVFSPSVPAAQRVKLAASAGQVVRELRLINAVVVEHPQVSVAEAKLKAMKEVARVDEDPKVNWLAMADAPGVDFAAPSVAGLLKGVAAQKALARHKTGDGDPQQAGQETPWGITRVSAPDAWGKSRGEGVKVVVIDTGIDRTHPDLKANIKGGWNAITKGDDFNDDNGHGSHCTGTIAGVDDDQGVVGVAPKADIYGVKVLDANGSGTFDDVIAGMQWAVDNHMEVASMSLGAARGNPALADMVEAMRKAGVILIAAAGNSGSSVGFPAAYPGAIAVAASDAKDALASFSSRGPEVAVIAPGVKVKSTYMGGQYNTLSGTSMATPHVAGLTALYVSTHKGATPEQARAALSAAASKLAGVPDIGQGAGLPLATKLVQ